MFYALNEMKGIDVKMDCKDILNLIAIIVIPIVAVLIGQWIQNRSEKRKDKMQIFKTLMTSRIYGGTVDSIHAFNLIDIIFVNDKAVRTAWKNLFDAYSSTEQSDLIANRRKVLMYKLLEEMAKSLGYKEQITWENIQNPYVPQWIVDSWNIQAKAQRDYINLLNEINKFVPAQTQKEDKK